MNLPHVAFTSQAWEFKVAEKIYARSQVKIPLKKTNLADKALTKKVLQLHQSFKRFLVSKSPIVSTSEVQGLHLKKMEPESVDGLKKNRE